MNSVHAQITARNVALERLNGLTTWISVGAVAALGLFTVIAAATVPGKPASSPNPPTADSTAGAPTSAGTAVVRHHHQDSTTITASSGAPVVVSGGSH
jgi:cytochrome oxidase Cu insertion factor (SCO1/SenC/PrrC family)